MEVTKYIALSTIKDEYIAITEGVKKLLWMKKFLLYLGIVQEKFVLHGDSQSAIHFSKHFFFILNQNTLRLDTNGDEMLKRWSHFFFEKIHIDDNVSDMMIKPLPREKFMFCKRQEDLVEPSR
jgi:hypothetical protein